MLKDLDLLEPVLDKCAVVKGRMDWGPDGVPKERLANKAYDTQVIQRDRLVSVLVEEIEKSMRTRLIFRTTSRAWDATLVRAV